MQGDTAPAARWHPLRPDGGERTLPLEAIREPIGTEPVRTWVVRLPVRAERITIAKPVVVREEVVVRAQPADHSIAIESDVRREVLRVELAGDVSSIREGVAREDDGRRTA
jgi:stress response protein YsnF